MSLASQGFQQSDLNLCADDASHPTAHIRLKIDPRVERVPWDDVSSFAEKLKAGGLEVMTRRFDAEALSFLSKTHRSVATRCEVDYADSMKRTPTPR